MRKEKYTKELLEPLVMDSVTISEVVRKLTNDNKVHGGMVSLIKNKLIKLKIDFTHFKGKGWAKNKINAGGNALSKKDFIKYYLSKNPIKTTSSSNLKKYLFKFKLKENKCCECNLGGTWNNKPINNQLDHIDGNSSNNELKNLRILCPNCHSQTITYTGKNNKK